MYFIFLSGEIAMATREIPSGCAVCQERSAVVPGHAWTIFERFLVDEHPVVGIPFNGTGEYEGLVSRPLSQFPLHVVAVHKDTVRFLQPSKSPWKIFGQVASILFKERVLQCNTVQSFHIYQTKDEMRRLEDHDADVEVSMAQFLELWDEPDVDSQDSSIGTPAAWADRFLRKMTSWAPSASVEPVQLSQCPRDDVHLPHYLNLNELLDRELRAQKGESDNVPLLPGLAVVSTQLGGEAEKGDEGWCFDDLPRPIEPVAQTCAILVANTTKRTCVAHGGDVLLEAGFKDEAFVYSVGDTILTDQMTLHDLHWHKDGYHVFHGAFELSGPVAVAAVSYGSSPQHSIMDGLPILAALAPFMTPSMPLLLPLTPLLKTVLAALGFREEQLIPFERKSAFCMESSLLAFQLPFHNFAGFPHHLLRFWQRKLSFVAAPTAPRNTLVYFGRPADRLVLWRKFVNQRQVIVELRAHCLSKKTQLVVVGTEDSNEFDGPFVDLVANISQGRIGVGVHSGSFLNAFWLPVGAGVLEFSVEGEESRSWKRFVLGLGLQHFRGSVACSGGVDRDGFCIEVVADTAKMLQQISNVEDVVVLSDSTRRVTNSS